VPARVAAAMQDALVAADLSSYDWKRIGLLLGEEDLVTGHDRLLRSLYFGDEDYPDCVLDVLWQLADRHDLAAIVDASGVGDWLQEHRPATYRTVYPGSSLTLRTADLPDHELVDSEVIREHLRRMTDLADTDPATAISAAKDLVESTTKLVLRELGEEARARADVPELVREAGRALAVHPEALAPDAAGYETIRKLLGSLAQVAVGVAELRNQYGVGHGRTEVVYGLGARHAHLAVGAADTYCRLLLTTLADPDAPWRARGTD
jgi:hypothetical protein